MSGRQLRSFGEITTAHVVGYRNYVRNRKTRGRGHINKSGDSKIASKAAQIGSLNLFLYLVRLQGHMGQLGSRLDLHEVEDLLGSRAAQSETSTPRIPDHMFISVLNAAIEIVDSLGSSVAAIQNEYGAWNEQNAKESKTGNRRVLRTLLARKEAKATLVVCSGRSIDLMSLSHYQIRELIVALRGACFIIIAGLVGMRMCEIRSLRKGCLLPKTLLDGRRPVLCTGRCSRRRSTAKESPLPGLPAGKATTTR